MALDVYTYGGGTALYEVFNAVSTLMGSGDYLLLVKLFAVTALFWVVFSIAFSGKMADIKWFFMFVLMFFIMFTPKESVIIHDKFDPGATRVVANVPFGLARLAWFTSSIGEGLLRLSEAVFSLPNDLNYSKNGMVFGSKVLNAVNTAQLDDPLLKQNMNTYTKQCVYYNMAYGFYSTRDLMTSEDILGLAFSTTHNSNIRGMFYNNGTGVDPIFLTCAQAAGQLRTDLTVQVDGMLGRLANAIFSNNSKTDAQKKADFLAALPLSYNYIAGIGASASATLTQTALANYFRDSGTSIAAMSDSAAMATALAETTAARHQRSSYRVMGEMAERNLPMMRTVFEVLIYGTFFIIFLAFIMPLSISGKALITYIKVLVWIQLWPILYSILNMVMVLYSASSTRGVGDATLGITSMAGLAGMVEVNTDLAIMAGYLGLSIPLIAWTLLTPGGHAMSQLAAGLMAPASQAANQAAGEIARGNISTGNVQMGNTSTYQESMGPNRNTGSTYNDGAVSSQISGDGSGRVANTRSSSDMGASVAVGEQLAHNVSTARTEAQVNEQMHSKSLADSKAEESTAAHNFVETASTSSDVNLQQQVSEVVEDTSNFQTSQDVAHSFAQEHNLTDQQSSQILANASASVSGGFEIFGNGGKVQASAQVKGMSDSQMQDAYKIAKSSKIGESYNNAVTTENKLAEIASNSWSDQASQQAADQLTDAHKHTVTEKEQWSSAHKRSDQLQEAEAFTKSNSFNVQGDYKQDLENFIVQEDIKVGRDDVGKRTDIASSADFQEYLLDKQGVQADINNDGKVTEWKKEIADGAENLETGAPDIPSPTGAAQAASHDAGLRPGELPLSKMGNEIDKKIEAGKQAADEAKQKLATGKQHVQTTAQKVKSNVQGQSIDTSSRALVGAGDAIVNTVGDAAKGALSAIDGIEFTEHNDPGVGPGGLEGVRGTHEGSTLHAQERTMGDMEGGFSLDKPEAATPSETGQQGEVNTNPVAPEAVGSNSANQEVVQAEPISGDTSSQPQSGGQSNVSAAPESNAGVIKEPSSTSEPQGEAGGGYNATGSEQSVSSKAPSETDQQGEVNTNPVAPEAVGSNSANQEVVQAEPTSGTGSVSSSITPQGGDEPGVASSGQASTPSVNEGSSAGSTVVNNEQASSGEPQSGGQSNASAAPESNAGVTKEPSSTSEPQGEAGGGYNAAGSEQSVSSKAPSETGQQGEVNTNPAASEAVGSNSANQEVVQAEPTSGTEATPSIESEKKDN